MMALKAAALGHLETLPSILARMGSLHLWKLKAFRMNRTGKHYISISSLLGRVALMTL
jgi:hypothetical protein